MKPCRVLIHVLLLVVASAWLCSCSQKPPQTLAITHVTVIDATGAPPQPDMTLLIAAQRITALGPSSQISIPAGARIVDVTGKFLIPGLADMHIHLTGASEPGGSREFMLPLLVASGVTSVRDMGGYIESLAPLRRDIEQGNRLGPRIIFAGPYLDGSPPFFEPSLVVTNSVQASEDVGMLIQRGVDFIKVQSALSREAYFAVADSCKRGKVSFAGHVPDRVTAAEASDAGQRSIEHLTCVLRACAKDEPRLMREQFRAAPAHETRQQSRIRQYSWQAAVMRDYSEKNADQLIEKFRQNGTWQVPTLALLRDVAYRTPEVQNPGDSRNKYVPGGVMENWQKGYREELQGVTPREFVLRRAIVEKSMLLVAKMQLAGVRIMAGTDSAAPGLFPGFSLHEELALLVRAGLTPMQALQAATKSPAEFLGRSSTEGTVEKGKLANLVLLDANPLENIANTQKIRAVIILGKLLDRTALDALLRSAETFAATR
jgi:imidazolonepropionase-like amidohydrolase